MSKDFIVKRRESNLELYRVIVMLSIVAHHYVMNSGLLNVMNDHFSSGRTLFFYLFGLWGKVGINCFVLITGYYMCTSSITIKKFLKLLFEVEFYHVGCYVCFVIARYVPLSLKGVYQAVWPITSVTDGFAACFLLFYLFIPFLNILIKGMNRKMHQCLILLCLFIYTGLEMAQFIHVHMNYVSWFCVIYLVASYIRLYEIPFKNSSSKWGGYFVLSLIATIVSVIAIWVFDIHLGRVKGVMFFVADSNRLLSVIVSICAFNYFRNINIPYSKYINMAGGSTFGVLLIHAGSDNMRNWLWKDTLHVADNYSSDYFFLHALISVIFVFAVCVLIDQLRIRMVEQPLFRYLDEKCLGLWNGNGIIANKYKSLNKNG